MYYAIILILPMLCSAVVTPDTEHLLQTRSLTSLWPTIYRLLQSDPKAAACLLMKMPPSGCYQEKPVSENYNKRQSILVTVPDVVDDNGMTVCDEGNCDRSRGTDELNRGTPPIGPKRFYNNW